MVSAIVDGAKKTYVNGKWVEVDKNEIISAAIETGMSE